MPTLNEHLEKSGRNEALAELLGTKTQYFDWAVTILFYAAVHYVDAVLSVSRYDPQSHEQRHTAMGVNATLKSVYREYRTLEVASRNARYFALPIGPSDWHHAKSKFDILRAHIRTRLGLVANA